ncbi:response regulator [Methanoregula sp.]|uniref:sensor histidine kinase n=1 Tax=Methanoregula sp. TaxID=2052170 RepID=UPI003C726FB8
MISVLLIDDEPDHLATAKRHLEGTGTFTVDICPSAHEAIFQLSQKKYDAVVSDYDMPVMTGLDLLKKLKAEGDPTPFIMLTGSGPEHIVIEAFNEGASFYLKKHDDKERQFAELSHKIQLAVRRHHEQRNLDLFVDVTRHDLLNKVAALSGYVELVKAHTQDPKILGYLAKQQLLLTSIREQINFTRDYQSLGSQKPRWQDLGETIRHAVAMLPPDVTPPACTACGGAEIFADSLLVKVFYNLMDNSLRHGRHVTSMRFSSHEQAGGLAIIYEDDGIGITDREKESIFQKGKGKNTGLGLFLIREILTLTGITISETGCRGTGVRFELLVPADGYRTVSVEKTH